MGCRFSRLGTSIALVALAVSPALAGPDCTCRSGGRNYSVGEQVCLRLGGRERLAVCAMDQNVTSWQTVEETCRPVSSAEPETRVAEH
jgi:hypothetical protein